jgi:hypothetical protein
MVGAACSRPAWRGVLPGEIPGGPFPLAVPLRSAAWSWWVMNQSTTPAGSRALARQAALSEASADRLPMSTVRARLARPGSIQEHTHVR